MYSQKKNNFHIICPLINAVPCGYLKSSRDVSWAPTRRWKETGARHKTKPGQLKKEGTSVQEYNSQPLAPGHIQFFKCFSCQWKIFRGIQQYIVASVTTSLLASDYTIFWEQGQEPWHNDLTICLQNHLFFLHRIHIPHSIVLLECRSHINRLLIVWCVQYQDLERRMWRHYPFLLYFIRKACLLHTFQVSVTMSW